MCKVRVLVAWKDFPTWLVEGDGSGGWGESRQASEALSMEAR